MSNKAINPKHYHIKIKGVEIQVADIMEAFFPGDAHLSQAVKYLLRAGRKQSSSYLEDLGKAAWWIIRAIMFHGGKSIAVPPGAIIDGYSSNAQAKKE